jgi:choloylglycine hydrolase
MKRVIRILNIVACGLLAATTALPCTTFVLQGDGRVYFGRNLDWDWEDGLVVVNQRNVKKTAFVAPGHSPAKCTSKYGSVTFNQFGREKPFGGMNEAGLVVEQMMLFESRYPVPDSRPEIDMLQWIQYQLDSCSNVAEVVASDDKIRLEQPLVPVRIHYLVCDAHGDSAAIEFLEGKMVCHRGQTLPYHALANDTYEKSVVYARTRAVPAGSSERSKDAPSLLRFTYAAARAARFQPGTPSQDLEYAFETLEQVRQGKGTVWQIVYNVSGRQIHYRTQSNPQQRTLELKTLDFSCAGSVKFVDIQTNRSATGTLDFQ